MENIDFKLAFLTKQNNQLKNDLKMIKNFFYQLKISKDKTEINLLMEKILIILDIPSED